MSKITRATSLLFGSNAGANQIAQFGSLAAASPNFTTSPATIQALSNYLTGWFAAVIGANSPAIEDMNALCYLFSYQLSYMLQTGVPEWDSGTTYYQGSIVTDTAGGGLMYASLTNNNLNNAVTSSANWTLVAGNIMSAIGDTVYGGTNGAQTRLPGVISTTPGFLSSVGTGSASAAPIWRPLLPPTFQQYTSGSGTYNLSYWFRIASGNATAGATYTNNGVTFTVVNTVASATMVQMRGSGDPTAVGTLTKASGTGDATLTFLTFAKPICLEVEAIGGGAGGGGGGTTPTVSGAGGNTTFGSTLAANGASGSNPSISAGGTATTTGFSGINLTGGSGNNTVYLSASNSSSISNMGIPSPFGNPGTGNNNAVSGSNATGFGSGGGGGGTYTTSAGTNGSAGGAGGYFKVYIPNPASSYSYAVGAAGTAGSAGTNGYAGSNGAAGVIIIREMYQ